MRIAMIGVGYVGLVSGACLADFGHDVICIDKDAKRIAALQRGCVPFFEPDLAPLIEHNVRAGRLSFSATLREPVQRADVVFIAVGTPTRSDDGGADLSSLHEAAREIAAALRGSTVIVAKSTVPVGTGDEIERIIRKAQPDAEFFVVSNPEFLREGCAVRDFKFPDRVVIGTDDARARRRMEQVYRPLGPRVPLHFTSRRAAELTKYAANALLATKIAFINEIADLCESAGADVREVARGVGLDSRIGEKFLQPGPGYGGSCFPKDTLALAKTAEDHGVTLSLVEAVIASNEVRKRAMAQRIADAMGGRVRGRTVAMLGLTFKADTDDMRASPALDCIADLQAMGAQVRAYDPAGMENAKPLLKHVRFARDPYECAAGAGALVVMTEWDEFRGLDLARLRRAMAQPVLVDLRNIYEPAEAARHGFAYHGFGRGELKTADAAKPAVTAARRMRQLPETPLRVARPLSA